VTADLKARRFDDATFDSLLQRVTVELASVQRRCDKSSMLSKDLFDALRIEFGECC